jgi:RNA polymerase sigma-70 factor (ECF subfamily)
MKDYSLFNISEYVERAKAGDKLALDFLLKYETQFLKSYFSKKGIYEDDIPDIIQTILLKISKNLKNLENPNSFASWAKRITTNEFYDYLKRTNRHNNRFLTIKDDHLLIPDKGTTPPGLILNSELGKVINETLKELPRNFKMPIVMKEFSGFSYDKIADLLNVKVGTVKSRISRARSLIKNNLKEYIAENI